MLEHGIQLEVT